MVTFRQVIVTNFMISMFLRKFHEISRYFFFHGHFYAFHGWKFSFFSRPPFSVFTGEIWRKISRGLLSFHGQFSRHFHGKVHFFTAGNPKIFTGGKIFFTGKKKNTANPRAQKKDRKKKGPRKFSPQKKDRRKKDRTFWKKDPHLF